MIKKLTLTLGCLALLVTLSSVSQADAITFSFVLAPVHANSTGLTAGPALVFQVSDTKLATSYTLLGTAKISTGPASSYVAASNVLTAQYLPGPANVVQVQVNSASCVGGTMPGICLQGSQNSSGQYVASRLGTGSFQAVFNVDYVSPYVTTLFGDPNAWLPSGSDSFNTVFNVFKNGGTKDTALLTTGGISFQTPVPEPGTLALLGSGLVGFGCLLRRKTNL